ncbi:hypothetical protein FYL99_RS20085 [Escherichia coli]|nr:hypothetical protein [Escherichia coli]
MKDQSKGVRGYKQIHLKKFSKTISHNLKLLALSREINLYELHGQIIAEYIKSDILPLTVPLATDKATYNVFVGQEEMKRVEELSHRLHVPESEIFFSALVNFADKHNLSQEL